MLVSNAGFQFISYYQEVLARVAPRRPHLRILGVEILACMIPQDKEMQGIKEFNSGAEITQFADDTSLF